MKKFIIYLDKAFLHIFGTRSRQTHHNCSVFLGYLDQKRGIHGFGWSRHFRMSQNMRPIHSTGPKHRRLKMFLSVKVIIKTNKSSEMKILSTEEIFYNFYFIFIFYLCKKCRHKYDCPRQLIHLHYSVCLCVAHLKIHILYFFPAFLPHRKLNMIPTLPSHPRRRRLSKTS